MFSFCILIRSDNDATGSLFVFSNSKTTVLGISEELKEQIGTSDQ